VTSYDLITVGRVNMDLYAQDIGAEFRDVTGFDAMVGGSPTNIAIGTSRLGLKSIAFTGVGDDLVGEFVLRYLADDGVITDHIARKPGKLTSLALLGVQPPDSFPLSFYREDPADIHLTVEDAAKLPFSATRALLLSGNAFSRGTCVEAATFCARAGRESGLTTTMDLDLRPSEWLAPTDYGAALRPILEMTDVVIGTEEELYAVLAPDPVSVMRGNPVTESEHNELEGLMESLMDEAGVTTIVLKRGPRGVTVVDGDSRADVSGFEVEVVNTVGAGDAFASGLIWSRLQGRDWTDAVKFANACGAIEVTRHGCSAAFPTVAEVESFMNEQGGT